jgi:single-strand DNA-binding protein
MASVNQQTIIGRLGKDVEVKTGANGGKYTFIGVATDDVTGKDAAGKWQTETTWHDVTVFGQQAEYLGQHAKKGSSVYILGRTEKKKSENGEYRHRVIAQTVIVFGEGNGNSNGNGNDASTTQAAPADNRGARQTQAAGPAQTQVAAAATQAVAAGPAAEEDDLPF